MAKDLARKIVLDRRGQIYRQWKQELPLAIHLAEGFLEFGRFCSRLCSAEISHANGLDRNAISLRIPEWVAAEISARVNLDKEVAAAMPGALRRARQFLVKAFEKSGLNADRLGLLKEAVQLVDGRNAYRDPDERYGVALGLGRNGEIIAELRVMANPSVRRLTPIHESRAHLCFAGLRRKIAACALGAGRPQITRTADYVRVDIEEGSAYRNIEFFELRQLVGKPFQDFVKAGELVISQAVDMAKEIQTERLRESEPQQQSPPIVSLRDSPWFTGKVYVATSTTSLSGIGGITLGEGLETTAPVF